MAISNYTELKAAVSDWMARTDVSGNAADFISLAEARLCRLLGMVSIDAQLSGGAGDTSISVSSLNVVKPVALHIVVFGSEVTMTPRPLGSFSNTDVSSQPSFWAFENWNSIDFNCPLDTDYTFRLTYQSRFALSDAEPTNRLLIDSPDIYLAAAMVWGNVYVKDAIGAQWKGMLDEFILEQRNINAQRKRSVLTVDPALSSIGSGFLGYGHMGGGGYDGVQPDSGYSFLEVDTSLLEVEEP